MRIPGPSFLGVGVAWERGYRHTSIRTLSLTRHTSTHPQTDNSLDHWNNSQTSNYGRKRRTHVVCKKSLPPRHNCPSET